MATTENPAFSNELLTAMIRAFHLEGKRVTGITLKLEWNKFAKLTIKRAPLEPEARMLLDAMDRMHFEEV